MKSKKIGFGTLSLLLALVAFIWSFEFWGLCVGDHVLTTLNIPTWSNMASASGVHYTICYAFLFLVPALILGLKFKDSLFSKLGTVLSIIFIIILTISIFFTII